MTDSGEFWNDVYGAKPATDVSWYQRKPEQSLGFIRAFAPARSSRIIDVGCGASNLIGALAAEGYADLTGLDASSVAIDIAKAQLGDAADRITWIVADITRWTPAGQWDLWHDRAVFHFLVEPDRRAAYVRAISAALAAGSKAIIATFAPDGPDRCSGLPVQRYSAAALADCLGPGFRLLEEASERHLTPKGTAQSFSYAVVERC